MSKPAALNTRFDQYNAIFEQEIDGGFSVWVPDLPGCASQGDTLDQALVNIKEAIELYLEDDVAHRQVTASPHQFVLPIAVSNA